jgi:hypothetical protein
VSKQRRERSERWQCVGVGPHARAGGGAPARNQIMLIQSTT